MQFYTGEYEMGTLRCLKCGQQCCFILNTFSYTNPKLSLNKWKGKTIKLLDFSNGEYKLQIALKYINCSNVVYIICVYNSKQLLVCVCVFQANWQKQKHSNRNCP